MQGAAVTAFRMKILVSGGNAGMAQRIAHRDQACTTVKAVAGVGVAKPVQATRRP